MVSRIPKHSSAINEGGNEERTETMRTDFQLNMKERKRVPLKPPLLVAPVKSKKKEREDRCMCSIYRIFHLKNSMVL
jgi:hypothetical protein